MNSYIVIPTYNEADNLAQIVNHILTIHDNFHIIIVDDNSPDGTGKIADDLSQKDSRISVIHRPYKAGLGRAYIAGFKEALQRGGIGAWVWAKTVSARLSAE